MRKIWIALSIAALLALCAACTNVPAAVTPALTPAAPSASLAAAASAQPAAVAPAQPVAVPPVQPIALPPAAAPKPHTLTVQGTGIVTAKPDTARIVIGARVFGKTASEAMGAVNDIIAKTNAAMEALGIAKEDIRSSSLYMYPEYDYDKKSSNPDIKGYNASHELSVYVRNIDNVGKVIDAATAAGANMVSSMEFQLSTQADARNQALQDAVQKAREKAEIVASASGMKLGALVSVTESGAQEYMPYASDARSYKATAAATTVSTGQLEISASVECTFLYE